MSQSPQSHMSGASDYTRVLTPIFGALMLVASLTGLIFWMRGRGFFNGFLGLWTGALIVILLMGGFALAGSYVDRRLGHDVTFRLLGLALAFPLVVFVIYRLTPVFGVVSIQ